MQVACLMKEYDLNDPERVDKISKLREELMQRKQLGKADVIGLVTFDTEKSIVHYGYLVNSETSEKDLAELGLTLGYASIPDLDWEIYSGTNVQTMYETIESIHDIHCAIELFDSAGACTLFVA